ncbi:hypothetical protein BCR35DRAFT_309335 [Leucosporidium creatinivorum]|uniref:UspA domain-containing protein n=1 Tax=Leucosporidium creatinivorum TaxID=106004 RepID=A0A1Y2DIN4_9BASI|nr:hypothetical protein BCR35DRAFT_309335 [Leucosporidium creatinivorum]
MSHPPRPLIDRRRTSSRDRGALHSYSHSRDSGMHLRSALKHGHIHPEPREGVDLEETASNPQAPCSPPPAVAEGDRRGVTTSDLSLPSSGLQPQQGNQSNGSLPQYSRRVGFDTFDSGADLEEKGGSTGGGTGVNYSFTIGAKSSCFIRTRATRTYLVATDLNEYSVHALNWCLSSITEDHDEIVVLRVIDPGSSAHSVWKAGQRGMEEAREEAEGVLEGVMKRNGEEKQISIIVEFAIGPIEETIHRMIEIYRPDSLIVGTRGRSESIFKMGAYMGSISKWSVARSPVPVIVVKPADKVRESLEQRSDRKRSYVSLLGSSAGNSSTMLGHSRGASLERVTTAPEDRERGRRSEESASSGKGGFWSRAGKEEKKEKSGKEMKRFETFS